MNKEYAIVTDGSCDLPKELCQEKGITVVPFYEDMVNNPKVFPKSSLPSVQDYMDAFMPIVQEGKAIICICITTKFSGSMQSALNARMMILEQYPDAEITVIDATINTVLQGIYVLEAQKMKEAGVPYEQVVE